MNYAKVTVTLNVPVGESCYHYENGEKQASCSWILKHTGSGQKWCRLFEEVNITNGMKCQACLKAIKQYNKEIKNKGNGGII